MFYVVGSVGWYQLIFVNRFWPAFYSRPVGHLVGRMLLLEFWPT